VVTMAGSIFEITKPLAFCECNDTLPKKRNAQVTKSLFNNWGRVGVRIKMSRLYQRIPSPKSRKNVRGLSFR